MKAILNFHIKNKKSFARVVFGYFILLLVYRFHGSTFLIYTFGQPVKGPGMDYAFWMSHCSGFPHYIVQHYWACVFIDISVVILSFACFISDKYRNICCSLLILFFFIQRITVESYSCSHTKNMSVVFVALLPFCFKKEKNFNLIFEFSRYFLLFVMVSSAVHKFSNGLLLSPENFVTVLINQHSDLATLNPQHICFKIAGKLTSNPSLAVISFILLFITQASFFIGFITRRFDTILFILLLMFALTTYFIMRIYNFDILVLGLFLLYFFHSEDNTNYTVKE